MTDERPCATHPRRAAVTSCAVCGQGVCRDCAEYTGVGFKCADCSGGTAAAAHPTVQRLQSWRPSAVSVAVVVVVVILAGAVAFALFRPNPMGNVGGGLSDESGAGANGGTHNELDVAFAGDRGDDDVMLRGTLTVPAHQEGHAPAVVIVPGFGATNRDGVVGSPNDTVYRELAHTLADRGMVALRYDKRGAGESDRIPEDNPLTFDQRVGDAAAAVAYVRNRPEVDAGQVAMVGHDTGGFASMRVAGDDANLSGVVLIGTAGRPMVEVIAEAYEDVDDEQHDEVIAELERAVDELLATGELPEINEDLGMGIERILPEGRDEFLAGVFSVEPTEDAAEVTSPVLIVHGERDPNINHDTDVEPLRDAFTSAETVDVLTVPDAGHTLNRIDEDHDMADGGGPVERVDEALADIADWLEERFSQR